MELTRKQEEGLKIAVERYRENKPYTCISGYAGTGKSTLVRFIIAALDIDPHDVAYIAFTGKAAQVLQQKGNPNAMTAHRLLYKSIRNPDGSYSHIPHESLPDYALIVVDEVSMLPKKMWDLLISHHIHVIACGDPFQLPAVSGEDNEVLLHPHVFLEEIMRQAAESEIIRLSMDVREGRGISLFKGEEVNVVPRNDLSEGMIQWADQLICGKNATRFMLNDLCRKMKWGEDADLSAPKVGDKIICLKNDWDVVTGAGDALVNGSIGELTKLKWEWDSVLSQVPKIGFNPEGMDLFSNLPIDWKMITQHEPYLTKENYSKTPWRKRKALSKLEQFDYGYAITCWKAQGSEYNKVLFLAEKVGYMNKEEYARYMYTGITRASEKLTLVMGG